MQLTKLYLDIKNNSILFLFVTAEIKGTIYITERISARAEIRHVIGPLRKYIVI